MKRYDKYKHSGVEWMGEIPEYWNKKRLKHLTENNDAKRIPLSSDQRGLKQGDIPYYGANGIIDYIDEYIFDGDYVLIGEDGAPFFIPYRDVALKASGKFWVNNHAHILKCKSGFNENIFVHQLNSVDYKQYITGSTRDKLTQENLSGIIIIDIPSEEQTAIAGFLDEKTTQIDKLISNKQKLIELLKEERTAIINQAVTRGVNPNVKLKPSGIDWLGNIPEHWEVKKLKYLSESGLKNGLFKKSYEFGAGTKLINVSDLYVEGDYIDSKNLDRVSCDSAEENNYSVNLGDIFFVRSSLKREGVAKPACIRVVQEPIVFECHLIKMGLPTLLYIN